MAALVGVGAWGLRTQLRRNARTEWKRPLRVAVVLLGDIPPSAMASWRRGGERLERWMQDEFMRWRGGHMLPASISIHGPVPVDRVPDFEPEGDDLVERARHAWQLWRALRRIDDAAQLGRSEVRIYVALQHLRGPPSVEGVADEGGEVGLVRATADEDPELALTAIAHELFHCLGASDKYDQAGHARANEGWAEPERGLPQRYAEVMVGEVPLGPARGRVPVTLDEVRVGATTARELKWR